MELGYWNRKIERARPWPAKLSRPKKKDPKGGRASVRVESGHLGQLGAVRWARWAECSAPGFSLSACVPARRRQWMVPISNDVQGREGSLHKVLFLFFFFFFSLSLSLSFRILPRVCVPFFFFFYFSIQSISFSSVFLPFFPPSLHKDGPKKREN